MENAATRPRALLSVYDKTNIIEFATGLAQLGFELVSTGGTARKLKQAGLEVVGVSDIRTGYGSGGHVVNDGKWHNLATEKTNEELLTILNEKRDDYNLDLQLVIISTTDGCVYVFKLISDYELA